jgi:hypothetical protein
MLQRNDGSDPLAGFMQAVTKQMIEQLRDRVSRVTGDDPGQDKATGAQSGASAAADQPPRERTTRQGTPWPNRSKRSARS